MSQGNLGATRNKKASCFLDPIVGCHPADASVVPVVSRTRAKPSSCEPQLGNQD